MVDRAPMVVLVDGGEDGAGDGMVDGADRVDGWLCGTPPRRPGRGGGEGGVREKRDLPGPRGIVDGLGILTPRSDLPFAQWPSCFLLSSQENPSLL